MRAAASALASSSVGIDDDESFWLELDTAAGLRADARAEIGAVFDALTDLVLETPLPEAVGVEARDGLLLRVLGEVGWAEEMRPDVLSTGGFLTAADIPNVGKVTSYGAGVADLLRRFSACHKKFG